MAQPNYSDKFYSLLRQFIKNLEEQYPNLKKEFSDYRKYVKNTKKTKFTKNFYNRLQPYSEDISKCNYQKFEDADEPIYFFKNIDFRKILTKDTNEKNKEVIMQYLQSLYVIVNMIISGDELMNAFKSFANPKDNNQDNNLENFDVMKDMINNLSKNIEENNSENTSEESTEENNNKENQKKSNPSPFGFIEELAEEIAKDIEIPEELQKGDGNPGELFQKMFFGENNAFSSMVSKVGQKIHQKMESGELDTDKLMKETTGMMGNLQESMSEMQKDPEFMKQMGPMANMMQSMMSGMMSGNNKGGMPNMGNMMNMMSSMMGGGNNDNNNDEEMPDLEELQEKWKKTRNQEYRASAAKERLRRKLENKRKIALNQQRYQEKSLQRKGQNSNNQKLEENKEE